ncbi:MAG: sensor histidine kinase [Clostridiales bacterium]|nr:sensor histidine kinase [Clostridiales bacterium]
MAVLVDKGILLVLGILLTVWQENSIWSVVATLIGIITAALSIYFTDKKRKMVLAAAVFILSLFVPELVCFLPLVFYDCAEKQIYWGASGILIYILSFTEKPVMEQVILWLITAVLSVFLARKTAQQEQLHRELIELRDNSVERDLALKLKNKNLMEKQDYEIYLATLRERNRIAREIHDNVGHMLSRSILQMGALLAIHPENPLHEQLSGVSDTLNQAMNSIRESVHDLHDDSIDLKQVISEVLKPLGENYQILFEYDMGQDVPREVKYCFITVVKEAVSNILKHSDATKIFVILREHPAFYQLSVEDNGTVKEKKDDEGIGLINMRERVEALNGTFRVNREQGFRIFISVRKNAM